MKFSLILVALLSAQAVKITQKQIPANAETPDDKINEIGAALQNGEIDQATAEQAATAVSQGQA
tara:strand:- start:168 stop:359 length:192 start_codon:yes stop_codon:yes gene_type:complete